MIPTAMDWRVYQIVAWTTVSVCTLAYIIDGMPVSRPLYVFLGGGIAIAVLFWHVSSRRGQMSRAEESLLYLSGVFVGFYFRLLPWIRNTIAGSDMVAHYAGRAGHILEYGHINTDLGMYSHAPFIHILIATNKLITGLQIYDVRLVAVLLSATVPLAVAIVGRRAGGQAAGLYTLFLATAFPLFLRVGATFDSESLAIPFFAVMLFLLYRNKFSRSHRFTALLLALMLVSAWIHFLYPIIIVGTVVGGMWLVKLLSVLGGDRLALNSRSRVPLFATLVIFGFILFRIFTTDIGARMFVGLGISGAEVGTSPLSGFSLIPSGGAIGSTIRGGSGGGGGNRLLNIVLPIGIFAALAAIGGLRALYERTSRNMVILSVASVLGVGVFVGLVAYASRGSFRLGYRLYYFAGMVGLVFAGLALSWLDGSLRAILHSVWPRLAQGTFIVLVLVVLTFGTLGPMSSTGNAVDPYFGGQSIAITDTEYGQLSSLADKLDRPVASIRVPGLAFPAGDPETSHDRTGLPFRALNPETDSPFLTTSDDPCWEHGSVWVTDRYRLCS